MASVNTTDSLGVRTGLWTNWSRGPVLGWILTLDQSRANLLIALISFAVTIIGARLWTIVCFVIHFTQTRNDPSEALHHQRQVLLRNSHDAVNGVSDFTRLFFAWRKIGRRAWRTTLPLLSLSICWFISWTVASVFSSQVSTAMGNEVLLRGENCSYTNSSADSTLAADALIFTWYYKYLELSTNYAEQCYSSDGSGQVVDCNIFVRQEIPYNITTDGPCPFDESICLDNNSTVILDTGLIDSRDDFGLNTPDNQRLQVRMKAECAPIRTEGYTTTFNLSADRSYTQYWYGASGANFTYEWSNDERWEFLQLVDQALNIDVAQTNDDYNIDGVLNASEVTGSEFDPIPELAILDADLALLFLSANQILYLQEVTDPVFSATTGLVADSAENLYMADQPASPLACTWQQQFCFSTGSGNSASSRDCTPMAGELDVYAAAVALLQNRTQEERERFGWLLDAFALDGMSIYQIVKSMGSLALLAKESLTGGYQGSLPDNQWQLEVQHWFQINLAAWQDMFVSLVTGPQDSLLPEDFIITPRNDAVKTLCRNQKIISSAYTSFSMFALLFIFILGIISIFTSFLLPYCVYWARRDVYASLEWRMHHPLQLQRLAHQGHGAGHWSNTAKYVPVTKEEDILATLDVSDPKGPKLLGQTGLAMALVDANGFRRDSLCMDADQQDGGGEALHHQTLKSSGIAEAVVEEPYRDTSTEQDAK